MARQQGRCISWPDLISTLTRFSAAVRPFKLPMNSLCSGLFIIYFIQFANKVDGFRKQGVGVSGRLFCGEKRLRNARVRIYDIDRNWGDPDDLLDEGFTDANGEFMLDGTTRELTTIEPKLYIYHDCNDPKPCLKRVVFDIPKKYIHHGTVKQWYDIGELDMSRTFPNEDRVCLNQ